MFEPIVRVLGLCLALAGAEMLHGIARVRFVVPRLGKGRAQKVSIVTGSLLAFLVCWFIVPTLGLDAKLHLLALGFVLSLFMASFDIVVARVVMKRRWTLIAEDFDPRRGNYLAIGLALMLFFPLLAMALRSAK